MASPRELFAHPATAFVANFLGFDNILDGTIETAGSGTNGVGVKLANGVLLHCPWQRAEPAAAGAPVTVAFRSERVVLAPAERTAAAVNTFHGTVTASVYLGLNADYLIDSGGLTVRVLAPGDCPIASGTAVAATVRAEDCIVYPRSAP
jgi:ABC-type Fe3+/spermidine/putrescine transport system ATPase subunit